MTVTHQPAVRSGLTSEGGYRTGRDSSGRASWASLAGRTTWACRASRSGRSLRPGRACRAFIALDPSVLSQLILHESFRLGDGLCVGLGLLSLGLGLVRGLDRLEACRFCRALRLVRSVLGAQRIVAGLGGLGIGGLSRAPGLGGLGGGFAGLDDLACDL